MAVQENKTRKAFQQAVESRDKKLEKINSGELGVELWCKVLRAKEQSKFSANANGKDGLKIRQNYAAEYLSICLCDDKGELLFPGENGVIDLQDMPAPELEPILDECHRVNGAKDDHKKNSGKTGENGSSSSSPVTSTEPKKNS